VQVNNQREEEATVLVEIVRVQDNNLPEEEAMALVVTVQVQDSNPLVEPEEKAIDPARDSNPLVVQVTAQGEVRRPDNNPPEVPEVLALLSNHQQVPEQPGEHAPLNSHLPVGLHVRTTYIPTVMVTYISETTTAVFNNARATNGKTPVSRGHPQVT
jgi:hypothetical protein